MRSQITMTADFDFSPDSTLAIALPERGPARLFDMTSGDEVLRFKQGSSTQNRDVVFFPGLGRILLTDMYYTAGVYSLNNGKRLGKKWELTKKGADLRGVVFLESSERLLFAHTHVQVHDLNGTLLDTLRYAEGKPWEFYVKAIAASPSTRLLAIGWGTCRPRPPTTGVSILTWPECEVIHSFSPSAALAIRPNAIVRQLTFVGEETVAVGSDECLGLFALNGRLLDKPGARKDGRIINFPQSNRFFIGENGRMELWSHSPIEKLGTGQIHPQWASAQVISPDEEWIVIAGLEKRVQTNGVYPMAEIIDLVTS
jgi:hypothetical protein